MRIENITIAITVISNYSQKLESPVVVFLSYKLYQIPRQPLEDAIHQKSITEQLTSLFSSLQNPHFIHIFQMFLQRVFGVSTSTNFYITLGACTYILSNGIIKSGLSIFKKHETFQLIFPHTIDISIKCLMISSRNKVLLSIFNREKVL